MRKIHSKALGTELRRMRHERGLSAKKISDVLGIDEQNIYNWEFATRPVKLSPPQVQLLCDLYGISFGELVHLRGWAKD